LIKLTSITLTERPKYSLSFLYW